MVFLAGDIVWISIDIFKFNLIPLLFGEDIQDNAQHGQERFLQFCVSNIPSIYNDIDE